MRFRKLLAAGLATSLAASSFPMLILQAASGYTRMEAETYAVVNNYNGTPENVSGASGEYVLGGASSYRAPYADLSSYMDKSKVAYVQYEVEAPSDGTYSVVVGMTAGFGGSASVYSAIQVNGKDTYKAEATGSGNAVVASSPVVVRLEKGRNVIRCTGLTSDQTANVGGWINHDYLDVDNQLTPLTAKDTTTVEAENSQYKSHYSVSNDSAASGSKVLGSASTGDAAWDRTSIEDLSVDYTMNRIPCFALTVTAPADGYYDMTLRFNSEGTTSSKQIGLVVDGVVKSAKFDVSTSSSYDFTKNKIDALTYLTAGEHTVTFTIALPETRLKIDSNSYKWMNMDCVILGNGLTLSSTQKDPQSSYAYKRLPATTYANGYNYPDRTAYCGGGTSDNKGVGGANGVWADDNNPNNFMDKSVNSFVEYMVIAPEDGEYDIRLGIQVGNLNNDTLKQGVDAVYSAVQINGGGTIYKAKFLEKYGNSYGSHLVVSLKKGRNIIRATSMLEGQTTQKSGWWISQHYLDISGKLAGVLPTSVAFQAEDSQYINKMGKVAGNWSAVGQMLGNANYDSLKATKLTMSQINMDTLTLIPYFSLTVTAPEDGYYSMEAAVVGNSNIYTSQIAVVLDGVIHSSKYSMPASWNFTKTKIDATLYLTKGDHVITFTTPIMKDASDPYNNYGDRWMNYDQVILYGGLTVAETQQSPTDSEGMVRYKAYDYGLFNLMNRVKGTSNSVDRLGQAEYTKAQKTADILANGIDPMVTPFSEYTINAPVEGDYLMLLGIQFGVTGEKSMDKATLVFDVNGVMQTAEQSITATGWQSSALSVNAHLKAGRNVIRVTYFTGDSVLPDGRVWMDTVYLEVPASLTVMPLSGTLEAEDATYNQYGPVADSGSSGARKLGGGAYGAMMEQNIRYDTLNDENMALASWVKYSVYADKAGTYSVAVSFITGTDTYGTDELSNAFLAMYVNGKNKQKINFFPFRWGRVTTIVSVNLEEGENTILITSILADFIEPTDSGKKLQWVDQDCITLPDGVHAIKYDNYGLGDDEADVGDAQLAVKPASASNASNSTDTPHTGEPYSAVPFAMAVVLGTVGILTIARRRRVHH